MTTTGWEAVTAGAVEIVDRAHLKSRIDRGDRLRVKLGLDPTKPDIHLGHTVVLRALRRFQEHGHRAVLIIGDTTAQIGDPSGQSATRPQLTRQEVEAAADSYLRQAWKILDEAETEVRMQSEWFGKMRLSDVVSLMSRYTVARMLTRDDFAKRYKDGRPIGFHELLYPLLQAYDSVAVKADLELGGTDQTFNLLAGRDIQQAFGQPPQDILTTPLLLGLDGIQKMSQSLGNYIGIDEPAADIYWKTMKIPDELILAYFRLVTDLPPDELQAEERRLHEGHNPRDAKKRLARRLVTLFHDESAARAAEAGFGVQQADIRKQEVPGVERTLAELFLETGLVASKGEARRLAAQGGLSCNNEIVSSVDERVKPKTGWVLARGKHGFVELVVR